MSLNLSFWEKNTWFSDIDYAIVGSGIVGLSCALELKKRYPGRKIAVFEKGMLPSGASTKNAGFACFGSVSEILEDLRSHSEDEVIQLVRDRFSGLKLLREAVGDKALKYENLGGYELFTKDDISLYENCIHNIAYINKLLKEVFLTKSDVFSLINNDFSFKNIQNTLIFNHFEGQLDTGAMMQSLITKVQKMGILVLNSAEITNFSSINGEIRLKLKDFEHFNVKKLFIATNGFAKSLISEALIPARAQVLITKPISNLHIKGTFHLDRGYYYFRNVGNRILFGGGRNLDFETEETTHFGLTEKVQNKLEQLLSTTILPEITFEIDDRWSGIMGVGGQKKPIVKKLEDNVYCGVRLGGMGVAIGSSIGKQLADLVDSK